MSQEQDKVFFRNFSLIVGALAVLMVIFIIAARIVGYDENAAKKRQEATASKLTAPMGEVSTAAPAQETAPAPAATETTTEVAATGAAPAPAATETTTEVAATGAAPAPASDVGKKVYDGLCTSCHGTGIPGIPQRGDKAAWEPRIAQGKDTLYKHALEGFTGTSGMMMPPKGGGTNTDEEVKAAVDYIVAAVQAGEATTAPAAAEPVAAAVTPAETPAATSGADGKKVFEGLCTFCHSIQGTGAPLLGDKAAWAPRIAQGKDTLYKHALEGYTGTSGMMPPKGGGTNTDDEVKAAVDYMVSNSQ